MVIRETAPPESKIELILPPSPKNEPIREIDKQIEKIARQIDDFSPKVLEPHLEFPLTCLDNDSSTGLLPLVKDRFNGRGPYRNWVADGKVFEHGCEKDAQMVLIGGTYPREHLQMLFWVKGEEEMIELGGTAKTVWKVDAGRDTVEKARKRTGEIDLFDLVKLRRRITDFEPNNVRLSASGLYSPIQKEIIRELFRSDTIARGEFKLTSGRVAPYIFNIPSSDKQANLASELSKEYAELARIANADIISPVPSASNYVGNLVAERLGLPQVSVAIKAKRDEVGNLPISGFEQSLIGKNVFMLDDAITSGGSILKAVEGVRAREMRANYSGVLIDRQEGGRKRLDNEGVRLLASFGAAQMVEFAYSYEPLITREEYEKLREYLAQYNSGS